MKDEKASPNEKVDIMRMADHVARSNLLRSAKVKNKKTTHPRTNPPKKTLSITDV